MRNIRIIIFFTFLFLCKNSFATDYFFIMDSSVKKIEYQCYNVKGKKIHGKAYTFQVVSNNIIYNIDSHAVNTKKLPRYLYSFSEFLNKLSEKEIVTLFNDLETNFYLIERNSNKFIIYYLGYLTRITNKNNKSFEFKGDDFNFKYDSTVKIVTKIYEHYSELTCFKIYLTNIIQRDGYTEYYLYHAGYGSTIYPYQFIFIPEINLFSESYQVSFKPEKYKLEKINNFSFDEYILYLKIKKMYNALKNEAEIIKNSFTELPFQFKKIFKVITF